MAVNVHLTNLSAEILSRSEMLSWVNTTLQCHFTKVEEMCTGAAYCQFMDLLFPGSVPLHRVKFNTNQERDFIQNYKILQGAFEKVHVEKFIPVEKLAAARSFENLEFLQWFKKFFDANFHEKGPYDAEAARKGEVLVGGLMKVLPPTKKIESLKYVSLKDSKHSKTRANTVRISYEGLKKERDFFFKKLRGIEIICQKNDDDNPIINKILSVLYAGEEGFAPPDD